MPDNRPIIPIIPYHSQGLVVNNVPPIGERIKGTIELCLSFPTTGNDTTAK